MKELLTLDEARLLLDPPLSLFELIQATFLEDQGIRELPKVFVMQTTRENRTFIRPADLVKFARKHGMKIKIDNA